MIGICFWGVAVEISQTASVTALEPVQNPMQYQDNRLAWTAILGRSVSDKVALCQLEVGFCVELEIFPATGYGAL